MMTSRASVMLPEMYAVIFCPLSELEKYKSRVMFKREVTSISLVCLCLKILCVLKMKRNIASISVITSVSLGSLEVVTDGVIYNTMGTNNSKPVQ